MNINDYVRTRDGLIGKIIDMKLGYSSTTFGNSHVVIDSHRALNINFEDIIKSSPNIIDLIEVGDIIKVDGLDEVREVINDIFFDDDCFNNDTRAIRDDEGYLNQIIKYNISSVITHEQFESMEYKL